MFKNHWNVLFHSTLKIGFNFNFYWKYLTFLNLRNNTLKNYLFFQWLFSHAVVFCFSKVPNEYCYAYAVREQDLTCNLYGNLTVLIKPKPDIVDGITHEFVQGGATSQNRPVYGSMTDKFDECKVGVERNNLFELFFW